MRSRTFFAQFIAALARDTPAYTATVSRPSRSSHRPSTPSMPDSETPRNPRSRAPGTSAAKPSESVDLHRKKPRERPLLEVSFLTVAEAAAVMGVSKMTMYRLVHSGELPAIRVGRSFRIPEQAVHDYLRDAYIDVEGA